MPVPRLGCLGGVRNLLGFFHGSLRLVGSESIQHHCLDEMPSLIRHHCLGVRLIATAVAGITLITGAPAES